MYSDEIIHILKQEKFKHKIFSLPIWASSLPSNQHCDNELLCRTDTDSQTLKSLWFPNETGLGGWAWALGWKCYNIEL